MEAARGVLARARATPERIELLRSALRLFEGTHNFHNYTRRVGPDDATSNRYVMSFVALDPVIVPSSGVGGGGRGGGPGEDGPPGDDTQWIPLQVVGQSFLLNQIRKMVSAAVDVARGAVAGDVVERSLTGRCRTRVDVAPPNGLFLDRSYFELYNRHKVKGAMGRGDKAEHSTLDWVEGGGGGGGGPPQMPPAGKEEFSCFVPPPPLVYLCPGD
jgi:tRNA U38,U39,U40 pseudouridine synthase TruA